MITLEDAIKMLEARLDCMHRSSSGIDVDCNREKCDDCDSNYAQGTVGEQQEALKEAISALEKQIPKKPMIKIDVFNENLWHLYCPTCGTWVGMHNKRLKQTDMHNNTNSEICAKCGQMFDLELGGNR